MEVFYERFNDSEIPPVPAAEGNGGGRTSRAQDQARLLQLLIGQDKNKETRQNDRDTQQSARRGLHRHPGARPRAADRHQPPAKRNGWTPAMFKQLAEAYTRLDDDPALRVGVLHAFGDHFTAGLDLPAVRRVHERGEKAVPPGLVEPHDFGTPGLSPPQQADGGRGQGICFTVGIELMLGCRHRDRGRQLPLFAEWKCKRGIMATGGATLRMAERAGLGNAMLHLLERPTSSAAPRHFGSTSSRRWCRPARSSTRRWAVAQRIAAQAPLAVVATRRNVVKAIEVGAAGRHGGVHRDAEAARRTARMPPRACAPSSSAGRRVSVVVDELHRSFPDAFVFPFRTCGACRRLQPDRDERPSRPDRRGPAAPALPDPAATSVGTLGWMQGFPPAADKQITFDNPAGAGRLPRTRWSYSHVRETVPTANVWRGSGLPSPLPAAPRDLSGISFKAMGGEQLNFGDMLTRTYTDGILVLHRGNVVFEKVLRRAHARAAAPRDVGHQILRRHPRGHPGRRGQARPVGAGHPVPARTQGHGLWRRHGAPGHGHDHRRALLRELRRCQGRGLGLCARRRHAPPGPRTTPAPSPSTNSSSR